MIEVASTWIPEVKLIRPARRTDERGFFSEIFSERDFRAAGIDIHFCVDNHVLSVERNVLRGLHFQMPPFAQAKLLRVTRGRIFDVAVDIRHGSPTFGRYVGEILSAEALDWMLVPAGFAHGFCVLEPGTAVHYKVSDYPVPGYDKGLKWDDPALGISWPLSGEPILADRDRNHPPLAQLEACFRY
jgi:dTDP-4-dehydrorhamnose 3,5-epimerase